MEVSTLMAMLSHLAGKLDSRQKAKVLASLEPDEHHISERSTVYLEGKLEECRRGDFRVGGRISSNEFEEANGNLLTGLGRPASQWQYR
jgi:hypothetical protein